MTRKDYQVIAELIGELYTEGVLDAFNKHGMEIIHKHLEKTNPNYNRGRFESAVAKITASIEA